MSIATLKALAAQATAGPWNTGPSIDAELIAAMRNHIDALIAVAEAAAVIEATPMLFSNDVLIESSITREQVSALRAALARLEA